MRRHLFYVLSSSSAHRQPKRAVHSYTLGRLFDLCEGENYQHSDNDDLGVMLQAVPHEAVEAALVSLAAWLMAQRFEYLAGLSIGAT